MPEINNAIALGVQSPPPQKPADIIAPINSLAQLSYMNANADKVRAETGQIGQTTEFTRGKLQSISDYNALVRNGNTPEVALQKSGLAAYDPAGATSMLGNIKGGIELGAIRNYKPGDATSLATGGPEMVGKELTNQSTAATTQKTNLESAKSARELQAIRDYKPGDPTSLAAGGPEMVGKEVTNQNTAATTAKTSTEVTQQHMQLYGQVGNIMTAPGGATPQGRQIAADTARKAGIPEATIQQFMSLPDDQYMTAGQHLQVAAMSPEKYMDTSGQTKLNQGKAEAATSIQKVEPGQQIFMGPAAREAFTGGAPSSGVVGPPSLGNFGPAAPGAPSLSAPSAPALVAPAAPGAPAPAVAPPPGPNVRNVNAVPTPSVGVAVAPEIAEVAKKYEAQRPGLASYLGRTSQIESGGNPNAYNSASKAAGPFQFVPSTGAKYLNGASPFDVAGSADAAARLAIDNNKSLTQTLGRAPTDADLYLAHQQGATGAAKLLANPNVRAGDLVGNSAIAANGGNPNAPASAFTNLWATKFNGGTGRAIPGAALSPNVTATGPSPGASEAPGLIPGAIAPLAASLTPPAAPKLAAPPAPTPAPVPIQNTAPTMPVATPAAQPGGNVPVAPVISGQSPGFIAEQKTAGEGYGKVPEELDKAATAAKTTNATLDQMAVASDSWRMGKWADKEQSVREGLQAVAKSLGVNTPNLDNKIADYQDFVKQSGQILRQASHDTSSRVGVQEMSLIAKSLPNPELSEGGFKEVATQMKGLNDFAIAKQQASADWKAANGGSLGANKSGKDFQSAWNANASPAAFVLHRMQQENPAGLQNLISTMSKTPEGKAALQNMKSQMTWANDQGLFGK